MDRRSCSSLCLSMSKYRSTGSMGYPVMSMAVSKCSYEPISEVCKWFKTSSWLRLIGMVKTYKNCLWKFGSANKCWRPCPDIPSKKLSSCYCNVVIISLMYASILCKSDSINILYLKSISSLLCSFSFIELSTKKTSWFWLISCYCCSG
jgi:hypothetical protein